MASGCAPEGKKFYFAPAPGMLLNHVVVAGGRERAITSAGPYISLVDLAQGKAQQRVTIPGVHGDLVNCLNASPDSEHVVAALSSNKLWILEAESLNALAELDLGNRLMAPQQALYTPDGRHIVTVNTNGTVFVWRVQEWTSDAYSASSCKRAGRGRCLSPSRNLWSCGTGERPTRASNTA